MAEIERLKEQALGLFGGMDEDFPDGTDIDELTSVFSRLLLLSIEYGTFHNIDIDVGNRFKGMGNISGGGKYVEMSPSEDGQHYHKHTYIRIGVKHEELVFIPKNGRVIHGKHDMNGWKKKDLDINTNRAFITDFLMRFM